MNEVLSYAHEPGVVRNNVGRIVQTGWPHVPIEEYPRATQELRWYVDTQANDEFEWRRNIRRDKHGYFNVATGQNFFLSGTILDRHVKKAIRARMRSGNEVVTICDVGGGDGSLLVAATADWTGASGRFREEKHRLQTTLTTLINHDQETLASRQHAVHTVVEGFAIELPPENMAGQYDIVIAQRSVYNWSKFPELATQNLVRMCKPNGIIFATVPVGYKPAAPREMVALGVLLKGLPFVKYTHLETLPRMSAVRIEPASV